MIHSTYFSPSFSARRIKANPRYEIRKSAFKPLPTLRQPKDDVIFLSVKAKEGVQLKLWFGVKEPGDDTPTWTIGTDVDDFLYSQVIIRNKGLFINNVGGEGEWTLVSRGINTFSIPPPPPKKNSSKLV